MSKRVSAPSSTALMPSDVLVAEMSPSTKVVFLHLERELRDGEKAIVLSEMATKCGINRKTVGVSIAELVEKGFLVKDDLKKFGMPNRYRLSDGVMEGVKIIKPKKKKEAQVLNDNPLNEVFEQLWVAYDKKGNKKKAKAIFIALDYNAVETIRHHLKPYLDSTAAEDGKYRLNLENYLERKQYLSRIVKPKTEAF